MIEELWSQLIEFTSKLVVPDWGALIALIPIALAALVVLYLVWIILRFASAGPTRRGKHRLPPRTPPGIHMPGPPFAPVLGAIGVLFLGFGLVAGGLWAAVGATILVLTLLYWGRESLREYDSAATGQSGNPMVVGARPAPRRCAARGRPHPGPLVPPAARRDLDDG